MPVYLVYINYEARCTVLSPIQLDAHSRTLPAGRGPKGSKDKPRTNLRRQWMYSHPHRSRRLSGGIGKTTQVQDSQSFYRVPSSGFRHKNHTGKGTHRGL